MSRDGSATGKLAEYRRSIDNIDAALVMMLAERFKITQKVGAFKAEQGLPPADPGREEEQIARLRRLAAEAELRARAAEITVKAAEALLAGKTRELAGMTDAAIAGLDRR
jgi:chorismate mutase